jgi:tetratricopeptide (TPR) repeat protein
MQEISPELSLLAEYLAQGRVALFAGPDLSESADGLRGLPNTWQLANELAETIGYRGKLRALPTMAQTYEKATGRPALVDFLRQRLEEPWARPLPVHTLIARLGFPIIVSAGWDTLLEQAFISAGRPFQTAVESASLPHVLYEARSSSAALIYQIYGRLDRPETLRITENDQLGVFYEQERLVSRLKDVIEENVLLLVGHAYAADAGFSRLYYEVGRAHPGGKPPAFAVQSSLHPDEAGLWQARGITPLLSSPLEFLLALEARLHSRPAAPPYQRPPLDALSQAPRLEPAELQAQARVIEAVLEQAGVADLVEQTDVPLLSAEQVRDIEEMRAAYERLAASFAPAAGSAPVWLRQGNLEYARQNFASAEAYYHKVLTLPQPAGDGAPTAGLQAEALHNLYYALLGQRRFDEALQSYQQALALRPELAILPQRYRIERILGASAGRGRGGAGGWGGVVFLAEMENGSRVVIKMLERALSQNERALALFQREAAALEQLEHPHIVRLLEQASQRGLQYLALEYIEGRNLRDELQQRAAQGRPFSLEEAFAIIEQTGSALTYAHSKGLIHRDVKPSNILLRSRPGEIEAILIDFGIARPAPAAGAPDQTSLQAASGTLQYMAPEQAAGQAGDARTDLYALATVFYELLSGQNPSAGTTRPLHEARPELNPLLEAVIEKARQPRPADRQPGVAAFIDELRWIAAPQKAAAHQARLVRGLLRLSGALQLAVQRGWWAWLLAALLCLAVGSLADPPALKAAGRYLCGGLLITLLCTALAIPFVRLVHRRERSGPVAVFGPLMGFGLGLANSLLWLQSVPGLPPQGGEYHIGYGDAEDVRTMLLVSLLCSLALAAAALGLMELGGRLSRRLTGSFALGYFITYALVILLSLAASAAVYLVFGIGWMEY